MLHHPLALPALNPRQLRPAHSADIAAHQFPRTELPWSQQLLEYVSPPSSAVSLSLPQMSAALPSIAHTLSLQQTQFKPRLPALQTHNAPMVSPLLALPLVPHAAQPELSPTVEPLQLPQIAIALTHLPPPPMHSGPHTLAIPTLLEKLLSSLQDACHLQTTSRLPSQWWFLLFSRLFLSIELTFLYTTFSNKI